MQDARYRVPRHSRRGRVKGGSFLKTMSLIGAIGVDYIIAELTGVVEEGAALLARGTSPESIAMRFSAQLAVIAD